MFDDNQIQARWTDRLLWVVCGGMLLGVAGWLVMKFIA